MQLVAAKPEGPLSAGALNAKVGVMLLVELLTTSMIALDGHYGDVSQQTASATLPLFALKIIRRLNKSACDL